MGGRYAVEDNREIPDTMEALWEFEGGGTGPTMMCFAQYNANAAPGNHMPGSEMELRGTKGNDVPLRQSLEKWSRRRRPKMTTRARTPLDRETGERLTGRRSRRRMEPKSGKGSADTAFHARNFLDCVKSRAKCNCDIEIRAQVDIGDAGLPISRWRTKGYLEWDGKAERFTNNETANKHFAVQVSGAVNRLS